MHLSKAFSDCLDRKRLHIKAEHFILTALDVVAWKVILAGIPKPLKKFAMLQTLLHAPWKNFLDGSGNLPLTCWTRDNPHTGKRHKLEAIRMKVV